MLSDTTSARVVKDAAEAGGPLHGYRVLDLTNYLAGPYAANLFAQLGAEVIKVESCEHPEPLRLEARGGFIDGEMGKEPWNRSAYVSERHRNKLGITLDITIPQGRDILDALIAKSDVLLESYSERTLRKLRLRYEDVRTANPAIVFVSMSSRGRAGPDRAFVSYGPTLMNMSGVSSLTAYRGEAHDFLDPAYPDPVNSMVAVGFALAAMLGQSEDRAGACLDISQLEVMISTIGEFVVDYSLNQRKRVPVENRSRDGACQGVYRCAGDDQWIALAIQNDQEWTRFVELIGQPSLRSDKRFCDQLVRLEKADSVDRVVEEWTSSRSLDEVERALVGIGVACGRVRAPGELAEDEHLKSRSWFAVYDQPGVCGPHVYRGMPFQLSNTPALPAKGAPRLGEDNEYVFRSILGLQPDDLVDLQRKAIIGTRPTRSALESSGLLSKFAGELALG